TAFGPGVGSALAGKRPLLPFLLGYGEGTAYAWVSLETDLSGTHDVYASAPVIRTVDLAPGDSVFYTRRLYVTTSAALAASSAWMSRGSTELGTLRLDVEGKGERHVRGGTVEIRKHEGPPILAGELSGEIEDWMVPEGDVFVQVRHPERGVASSVKVSVQAGRVREMKLHLPQPAGLALRSIDGNGHPIPARWTFEGLGDTPTPDFGPRYDIDGAGSYHFTPGGSARVRVPPGRYRITATRGPAYQVWKTEVSLPAGKETGLEARLVRLEIPPAWVSADLTVHAVPTEDAPIGLDDRAKELACEGIEWFVSGDAGHRTTYASVIDTLRLAAPLHAVTGEEVLSPVGRFQAFPLPLRSDKPGNGALAGESLFLDAIFDRLHGEGEVLIQVLEPRAAPEGYFDRYAYTAKVDTARAGFRRDFDLIEILSGKSNPQFSVLWDDWMRLLGSDSPVTAVGNSDSRSLYGDEVGVPRNYVALEPSTELDPVEKFLEGVRLGRVVVSNGPFIDFTLGGVGVGGTLTARGAIQGHIRVVAPSWVDVKRVRVFLNGREDSSYMTRGRNRTVRFDEDIEITVNSPSFVVVRVEGDEPMDPVVTASGGFARPTPIAFTNPIWVKTEGGR
ncbi:MAG TPA: CehA/McbA family metallohydrolase, partial [Candidatus Eisenbacteria bacterium]|nr:CehA/McbA family metallohydrolase [Candidatus Eisenbacteria bacterium]